MLATPCSEGLMNTMPSTQWPGGSVLFCGISRWPRCLWAVLCLLCYLDARASSSKIPILALAFSAHSWHQLLQAECPGKLTLRQRGVCRRWRFQRVPGISIFWQRGARRRTGQRDERGCNVEPTSQVAVERDSPSELSRHRKSRMGFHTSPQSVIGCELPWMEA